jgi:sulfatase maturation enzyme AslB (radical SAM superfamily)
MGLLVTIRTLILRDIKVLHIEPTDVCQAACPLCARETDPEFNKSKKHHLRLDQIQQHFSDEMIANLDKMFMCGNYGDPAAGYYTLDIYNYFRKVNPDIILGMNSNGALQSTFFWHTLGKLFNQPQDYCVFSIDGLEDTNHVYRKNVNWAKLMANARAFISAGGSAHWDMLVYQHNRHQVDACEQLARDMGFKWFRAKISKRPYTNGLEYPIGWPVITKNTGPISCHALIEKNTYIDAQGRLSPCCWLGVRQSNFVTDFEAIKLSWETDNPDPTCKISCSTGDGKTNFSNQWQREIELQNT